MSSDETTPLSSGGRIDPSSAHFVVFLTWLIVIGGWMAVVVALVWQRRKQFPLAGRGSTLLMVQATTLLLSHIAVATAQLLYPRGLPCSLLFILLYGSSVPQAFIYLTKGWIFVIRLEILQYLEEITWRDHHLKTMQDLVAKRKEKIKDELQAHIAATVNMPKMSGLTSAITFSTPSSSPSSLAPPPLMLPGTPSKAIEESQEALIALEERMAAAIVASKEDRSVLPGSFFIHRRRWTEWPFIKRLYLGASLLFGIAGLLICVFDQDPGLTDHQLEHKGVFVDTGNQFQGDAILTAPICIILSMKIFAFVATMFIAAGPCGSWIVWRLLLFRRGQQRRAAKRDELAELVKIETGSLLAQPPTERSPTRNTKVRVNGLQLDDIFEMQLEFVAAIFVIMCWIGFYFFVQALAPAWYMMLYLGLLLSVMYWSSFRPVRQSIAIAKLYRSTQQHGLGVKTAAKVGQSPATSSQIPPHLRPYYDLEFLLQSPIAYPVLLTFLRKEFSSENALFLQEVRAFTIAAHAAEQRIQGWGPPSTAVSPALSPFPSPLAPMANWSRRGSRVHPAPAADGSDVDATFLTASAAQSRENSKLAYIVTQPTSSRSVCITTATSRSSSDNSKPQPLVLADPPSPQMFVRRVSNAGIDSMTVPTSTGGRPNRGSKSFLGGLEFSSSESERTRSRFVEHTLAADLRLRALRIHSEYLEQSAIYEVNLPANILSQLRPRVHDLQDWQPRDTGGDDADDPTTNCTSPTSNSPATLPSLAPPVPPPSPLSSLYAGAASEIFLLLQRDSLTRFVLTREFQLLLRDASEAELERLALQTEEDVTEERIMEQV